jgi:hypothetical protein
MSERFPENVDADVLSDHDLLLGMELGRRVTPSEPTLRVLGDLGLSPGKYSIAPVPHATPVGETALAGNALRDAA